jgi:hypothetical protein
MTEEKTFEPITTQEEFDERIKARLARERERWEKENGLAELKSQLEAKDEEITIIKREHYLEEARRAVVGELAARGVSGLGRIQRILKHVDLESIEPDENGQPRSLDIQGQLSSVATDMPELLTYRVGAGSGDSGQPVIKQEKPLTREDVENMSEEEVNSNWERVKGFLAGERQRS